MKTYLMEASRLIFIIFLGKPVYIALGFGRH